MKKILLITVLFPLLTFAQTDGELVVGERTVLYDTRIEAEESVLYFFEDGLVASQHEVVTLVYENDSAVLEAHDTNGDGSLDAFLTLDDEGNVLEVAGDGAGVFERPEPVEFTDLIAGEGSGAPRVEDDLVGDLSSISVPGYHNYGSYIFIVLIAGGAYWWYRKKKGENRE